MIETLLSGDSAIQLPELLGPGPQELLAHGARNGLFGTMSAASFISGGQLAGQIGLNVGTLINDQTDWLKFLVGSQVLYVAKRPIRHSVSKSDLEALGVVYGDYLIKVQGWWFKLRLLGGLGPTVSPWPSLPAYDDAVNEGSEWNQTLYYVAADLTVEAWKKHSQSGANWANYPQDASANGLNMEVVSWTREPHPEDDTLGLYRGKESVTRMHANPVGYRDAGIGYRPVLELDTELRAPDPVSVTKDGGFYDEDFLMLEPDHVVLTYLPPKPNLILS